MSYTRAEAVAFKAAAGATLGDLHRAIKARLTALLAYVAMESRAAGVAHAVDGKQPKEQPIQIFDGWLPDRASKAKVDESGVDPERLREQIPCILVRPVGGADSAPAADANSVATVRLHVATYSDTDDGWIDVLNLIDLIRLSLGSNPALEATAFEHTGPLQWEIPEDQGRPIWRGVVTTNWTIPRPARGDEM